MPYQVAQAHIDAVSLPNHQWLEEDHKDKDGQIQESPNNSISPATLQSLPLSLQQCQEEDCKDSYIQESHPVPYPCLPHTFHPLHHLAQVSPQGP